MPGRDSADAQSARTPVEAAFQSLSRSDKGVLGTRAAFLISAGKYKNIKELREKDLAGEYGGVSDDIIYARLRRIKQDDSLQSAAQHYVEEEQKKQAAMALADINCGTLNNTPDAERTGTWEAVTDRTAANKDMRKKLFFKFCIAKYSEHVRAGRTRECPNVVREAIQLYGDDVKWSVTSIKAYCDKHAAENLTLQSEDIPSPVKMGRPPSYPVDGLRTLRSCIKLLRLNKLPVFRETVIFYARSLIADTVWDANFRNDKGHHSLKKWFHFYYYHFLGVDDTNTGSQRPQDVRRAKWGTAANMKVHYDNLFAALLKARIAFENPRYDEDDKNEDGVPKEPKLLYDSTRVNRLVSMDESRVNKSTTGGDGGRKGQTERCVRVGEDDDGECLASKAPGTSFSAAGGSNAAFEGLRAFFILARESIDVMQLLGHLPCTSLGGKVVSGDVSCNTKGAMTGTLMITYVQTCIEPFLDPPVSKENPAVFLCDGVGVHMTIEFLEYMILKANSLPFPFFARCPRSNMRYTMRESARARAICAIARAPTPLGGQITSIDLCCVDASHSCDQGWIVVLRTPYCSEKMQNEDLYNFWSLKNCAVNGLFRAKQTKLGQVAVESGFKRQELTDVELLDCTKPAWEHAFSMQSNQIAWRMAGLVPFTCRPYWKQLAREQVAKSVATKIGSTELNVSALSLQGSGKRRAPCSPDADGGDTDNDDNSDNDNDDMNTGEAGEAGDAAEAMDTTGSARLVASDLAMLNGGPMSKQGIALTQLKHAIMSIKQLDASELKRLVASKDEPYKGVNEAKLFCMTVECASFGLQQVPWAWLPKDLADVQRKKLGIETAPAASKGKAKKKAVFAFGKAKEATNLLVERSAGISDA